MSRPNFRAHPCREVNGIQSYSIYKDNLPFIRPAENQTIDRSFASELVKLCTIHFAVARSRSEARSAGGGDGGSPAPPEPPQL